MSFECNDYIFLQFKLLARETLHQDTKFSLYLKCLTAIQKILFYLIQFQFRTVHMLNQNHQCYTLRFRKVDWQLEHIFH